jgi:hypothetical protein
MKPLPNHRGILLEEPEYFGDRCFSDAVLQTFPEITALREGGLHIQITSLAEAARMAIAANDSVFLARTFTFLETILTTPRLHPEVENAVAISFLAQGDFENAQWASELVPEALKRIIRSN